MGRGGNNMLGIAIGGIIWFIVAYCILCLPIDREIKRNIPTKGRETG